MKKILAVTLSVLLCFSFVGTVIASEAITPVQTFVTEAQNMQHRDPLQTGTFGRMAVSFFKELTPYVEKVTVTAEKENDLFTDLLLQVYDYAGATSVEMPEISHFTMPAPKRTESANDVSDGSGNPITGGKYSVAELSRLIRKYMFIRIDDPAQVAALIADTCEFSYEIVNGSDGTLYLRVNVEDNPQIFNYDVFRSLVEQLYEKQNEEMKKDSYGKIDYVMSYEHIVGELALHTIVFAALNSILNVTNTKNEQILNLYKAAAQADLNVDESRIPTVLIRFIGKMIIQIFQFNLLKLFSF